MADETPQPTPRDESADQANAPRLMIQTQYIKDLSFENPRAPRGSGGQDRPEIAIRVDVQAEPLGEDRYEVTLQLHADAKAGQESVFMLELTYGGVFALANIPAESLQAILLIECPRLLFPFARRIVADATRDGGFPPLMIDPIDFATLYRRRQEHAQAQQAQAQRDEAQQGEAEPAQAQPSDAPSAGGSPAN